MRREACEIALNLFFYLIMLHITDDDQGGIVGCIPSAIPSLELIVAHALQVAHPADHRCVIATGRIADGLELFKEPGMWIVVDALTAFGLHCFDFANKLGIGEAGTY
ncbi:hypothetical protein D3C77_611990 [compost metagenome]